MQGGKSNALVRIMSKRCSRAQLTAKATVLPLSPLSFQCPFPGYSCRCNAAWGLMPCRWNRVGLLNLPSPGISAAVLCAGPGHWGMNGIFFYCPHFAHIRRQFRSLYQDADGTMQCFVWHKDQKRNSLIPGSQLGCHKGQKAVCHCLAAILNLADDSDQDASS